MALKGTLQDFGIAEIFQLIGQQQKTGTLFVEGREGGVQVSFDEGRVIEARGANESSDSILEERLIVSGCLTPEEAAKAKEKQRETLEKLEHILLSDRLVEKEIIVQTLTLHTREMVYRLFTRREGKYEFRPGQVQYNKDWAVLIASEALLMDGFRIIDEWPAVERRIKSLDAIFRTVKPFSEYTGPEAEEGEPEGVGDETAESGDTPQEPPERLVHKAIDGRTPVRLVAARCRMGEFDAARIVASFVAQGIVAPVGLAPSAFRSQAVAQAVPSRGRPRDWMVSYLLMFVAFGAFLLGLRNFVNMLPTWGSMDASPELSAIVADAEARQIELALEQYNLHYGMYPTSLQALEESGFVDPALLESFAKYRYTYRPVVGGYKLAPVPKEAGNSTGLGGEDEPAAASGAKPAWRRPISVRPAK